MNFKTLSLLVVLSTIVLLLSCQRDEGCTDPASENFDPDARRDDGSCIPVIDKFLGTYSVEEECSSDFYNYTMSITGSSSDDFGLVIANFGDFQQPVTARVDGDFISIPDQSFSNNNGSINITNGLGELQGSTLTITYSYTIDGSATEICAKTCLKI